MIKISSKYVIIADYTCQYGVWPTCAARTGWFVVPSWHVATCSAGTNWFAVYMSQGLSDPTCQCIGEINKKRVYLGFEQENPIRRLLRRTVDALHREVRASDRPGRPIYSAKQVFGKIVSGFGKLLEFPKRVFLVLGTF